jgi:hypothetical protein
MTTTDHVNTQPAADARRARTLRWLLRLRAAGNLPMPQRIDFGQIVSRFDGRTLYILTLELDPDTDVTGWAHAVGADDREELPVTGDTHTWTSVRARTSWRTDGPRVDWHLIEVSSYHHYRPRADSAVTA